MQQTILTDPHPTGVHQCSLTLPAPVAVLNSALWHLALCWNKHIRCCKLVCIAAQLGNHLAVKSYNSSQCMPGLWYS
jgi:hypothetical protein